MKKQFAILLFSIFSVVGLYAQAEETGLIRGTIADAKTGEVLMFTNVLVMETDPPIGGQTDLDGNFEIKIAPGVYKLKVSYIGYADKVIEDVEVKPNDITVIEFMMEEAGVQLVEVVVSAKKIDRTENALLAIQKKAITVQDGISAQEMSRYGSSNAAESMKRVTGASVVDGKYIFVRGLGDRYSSAQLNGQPIPSTDPYRNSIQMDLIPSNLLDNLIASKTFTPDQPGNFTGGNVNIKTKSFPERFTLSASINTSFNTQSNLQDNFITYNGGDRDWLGFDDGTRELSALLKDPNVTDQLTSSAYIRARTDADLARLVDAAAKALSTNFDPAYKSSGLNHGVALSFGNQFDFLGNKLGVLVGGNYKRSYSFYDDGVSELWELTDAGSPELNTYYSLRDVRGTENPVLGGLVNLAYKFAGSNKLSFNALYNHDAEILSSYSFGDYPGIISGNSTFETRALGFTERAIKSYQLTGEHVFGENGVKLEWGGSITESVQNEPDLRFFANTFRIRDNGDTTFVVDQAEFDLPFHFFRELTDEQQSAKFDLTIPIAREAGKANLIKIGALYSEKDRSFDENNFQMNNNSTGAEPYLGNADRFFGDSNNGIVDYNPDTDRYTIGVFPEFLGNSSTQNSYTGTAKIVAGYAMGIYEFGRIKVIAGARVEHTDIFVASNDTTETTGDIKETDVLPSVNLIYKLKEDMNFRASFSQTLARPNMRELAPFTSFDFIGQPPTTGNPELERTLTKNYDLRWEWFPRTGEMIAASAYYKDFTNPIVKAYLPIAANPEITFVNVDQATVYGIELELRKKLDFIAPALENFRFTTNLSLIKSEVDISPTEQAVIDQFNPEKGNTRQFQGQSPFLFNGGINYQDPERGIDAIISVNVFGDRISEISEGKNPDVFEKSRMQLDFSFRKNFNNGIGVKVSALNLLNARYKKTMEYKGREYLIQEYTRGITFGLGLSYTIQ